MCPEYSVTHVPGCTGSAGVVEASLRHTGKRAGRGAIEARRFLLAHQPSVGREHGIELQRAEEGVVADVEADEGAELDEIGRASCRERVSLTV